MFLAVSFWIFDLIELEPELYWSTFGPIRA